MNKGNDKTFSMNPKIPKEFTFMADFEGSDCIWSEKGGASLDLYGFPQDLCQRSRAWLKEYFEEDDEQKHFSRQEFNQEGRSIAVEIKRFLGPDYKVNYRYISPKKDAHGRIQWLEEVIES